MSDSENHRDVVEYMKSIATKEVERLDADHKKEHGMAAIAREASRERLSPALLAALAAGVCEPQWDTRLPEDCLSRAPVSFPPERLNLEASTPARLTALETKTDRVVEALCRIESLLGALQKP